MSPHQLQSELIGLHMGDDFKRGAMFIVSIKKFTSPLQLEVPTLPPEQIVLLREPAHDDPDGA